MKNHVLRIASLTAFVLLAPIFASTSSASDPWSPLFKIPVDVQIIDHVGAVQTLPTRASATVASTAGLNPGDAILVHGVDNTDYLRHVVTVDSVLQLVTWDQPLPVDVAINSELRSVFSVDPNATDKQTLSAPKQSAIDGNGTVYILDTFNNRVVAADQNGTALWDLGGYARIYDDVHLLPADQWGAPCDNVPVADCTNDIQTMLGKFWQPYGIDVSADGKTLVVSDRWNNRVQVLTRDDVHGTIIPLAINAATVPRFTAYAIGGYGSAIGQMNSTAGVSLTATGKIVVSDEFNQRIEIFTPSASAAFGPAGHKYSATAFGHYGPETPSSATDINFFDPEDVRVDPSTTATAGRIVVADTDNHRVQVFDPSGAYILTIGSGPLPDPGFFDTPEGIAIDDTGRIYVVDSHNSRIQVFRPSGASAYVLDMVFGTEQTAVPIPGLLPLISPTGAAFGMGRLVITEQGDNRLQVLARSSLDITSLTTALPSGQSALRVDDPADNTISVDVVVQNSGALPLTNLSLTATASHPGQFTSPPTAPTTTLAPAHSTGDTTTFHFVFKVTDIASTTLQFSLVANSASGPVSVTDARSFDTLIVVNPPAGPGLSLGTVSMVTSGGGSTAGLGETVTVTVPLRNIGNVPLLNIAKTVTPSPTGLVTPMGPAPPPIASLAGGLTANAVFTFTTQAAGTVTFNASATSPTLPSSNSTTQAPNAPALLIQSDNTAPTITISLSPLPSATSADGKNWYNGAPGPCTASGCPPRPVVGNQQIVTWPTIQVVAKDETALKQIGWRMVRTSSQPQSDQIGNCTVAAPSAIAPSNCVLSANGSLTWTRMLTSFQKRLVIAFFAEDQAGNGTATISQMQACDDLPESQIITTLGNVTCVDLHVDTEPPTITQGATVFNADNTGVTISLIGGDPFSLVSGMTSPQEFHPTGLATGDLVLHSEGPTINGQVTVYDFARNSATFSVPLAGKPAIRLDHTPPDAFNRLDPKALGPGRVCTTTVNGQPVNYLCINKVYGTDNLPGFPTTAFAPVSVVPTKWDAGDDDDEHSDNHEDGDSRFGGHNGDDRSHHRADDDYRDSDDYHRHDNDDNRYSNGGDWDSHYEDHRYGDEGRNWGYDNKGAWHHDVRSGFDHDCHEWDSDNDGDDDDCHDWDGLNAELHTYTFTDQYTPASGEAPQQNPNRVTLVEKYRQDGNEARVRVLSYQYTQGSTVQPVVNMDWAFKKYEWSVDDHGTLKELEQKFEIHKGKARIEISAKYDAKKNLTRIHRDGEGCGSKIDVVATGLILLRMRTTPQDLVIEWDVNAPVPIPDIAAPVVTVPAPMVKEATGPSGATVSFTVSAFDFVDGLTPAYCTPSSGLTFPLGTTTVSCNSTDLAGNVGQSTFTVTVRDTTRPILTLPADITINANQAGGAIVMFSATATDTVDTSVPVLCSAASGSLFNVGTTYVTCAGADDSGNVAMGTFRVTVKDTVAPVLTLPGTITLSTTSSSGLNVNFTATAVDVVDGVRTVTCSPSSGSKFKVGTSTVSCSASDLTGNAMTGSFSVVVKKN